MNRFAMMMSVMMMTLLVWQTVTVSKKRFRENMLAACVSYLLLFGHTVVYLLFGYLR
jgi:hypothetical protein